ncbi:MAG: hypothetical protein KVP17_005274 [Porospora cf. gigantea B]|uniref:uncharacterized protein n=1 Tax=Porospora cf. gigantea B TaxID=2853592 RepID=UPI0035719A22|nr:MAG: hypothetical protein KVP17_005274 [Porospora cf. gigantea B]
MARAVSSASLEEPLLPKEKKVTKSTRSTKSTKSTKGTKATKSTKSTKSTKNEASNASKKKPSSKQKDKKPAKTAKTITKRTAKRTLVKKTEGKRATSKAKATDAEPQGAEKFFKAGQRNVTPPNGDGTRGFYESLLAENPKSIIAIKWCVENGCLMGTQHKDTLHTYQVLKELGGFKGRVGGLRPDIINSLEKGLAKERKVR